MRWKPQVFSLSLRLFYEKTKIRRRQLRAIREIRWLEEIARSAYLHCINFGIVDAPTRSVFLVVADRHEYYAAHSIRRTRGQRDRCRSHSNLSTQANFVGLIHLLTTPLDVAWLP